MFWLVVVLPIRLPNGPGAMERLKVYVERGDLKARLRQKPRTPRFLAQT